MTDDKIDYGKYHEVFNGKLATALGIPISRLTLKGNNTNRPKYIPTSEEITNIPRNIIRFEK